MHSITLMSHTDQDGLLTLQVDTDLVDTDVEVTIIVQPSYSEVLESGLGDWPPDFFEQTFGAFRNTPLVREPQGTYEAREGLV